MKTTVKHINFRATQEDLRLLHELMEKLKENQSQIIRRALYYFYIDYTSDKLINF